MENNQFIIRLLTIAVILLCLTLSGCGYFPFLMKTKFLPETEDVTISVSRDENGPFRPVTNAKKKFLLNQYKPIYFIKQEKVGYVSGITPITRRRINYLKKVDLITMGALDLTGIILGSMFLGSVLSDQSFFISSPIMYTMLGVSLGGWAVVAPAPGMRYATKIELPELTQIKKRGSEQLSVKVNEFNVKLGSRGVIVRDHPTIKELRRGFKYETRDSVSAFEFVEDVDLKPEIANSLRELNFEVDSATASIENSLLINSRVKTILFEISQDKIQCILNTAWMLETTDMLQPLYAESIESYSEWLDFNETELSKVSKEMVVRDAMTDALNSSLYSFVAMDTVQSILNNPVPLPLLEEKELKINPGNQFASSIAEAVESVITVVTKKGHGSGSIITPDGYVITNAHVVKNDTTELMAIFSGNTSKKIPLEFVRKNDAVDLALLKIDSTGFLPIKVSQESKIGVGKDVYAIGTPADIDLGQSVTRGIISGKRKFRGHELIQTDVPISPGNSGGPLAHANGEMVGVVTSALEGDAIDDINFAIPSVLIEAALKIKLTE